SSMPDISIFCTILHLVNDSFYCIKLIWPEHHKGLVCFCQHDILTDHFRYMTWLKEGIRESIEDIGKSFIFLVGPVKCLLEGLVSIVGVVLGIDTIADHKNLDILKQGRTCSIGMPV